MRNIKLAVRTLLKTPFVSAIAILSLALGIGANAAIYSMFDQVLMRRLPVSEPGQLVNLSAPGPMPGSTACNQAGNCDVIFSYQMFRDLEKAQTSFTGIAAHRSFSVSLGVRNEPVTGDGMMVSGSYFPWGRTVKVQGYDCGPDVDCGSSVNEIGIDYFKTFGVALRAGREFTEADVVGAQRVAIVNEAFAKKFNLGADVVGKFMGEDNPPAPGGRRTTDSLNIQIVGLIPNIKYSQVKDSVPPVYYRPWR